MKFSTHIQTQVNKANWVLGALKYTFSALDRMAVLSLYNSLIRPHLEYPSVAWNPKYNETMMFWSRSSSRQQEWWTACHIFPILSNVQAFNFQPFTSDSKEQTWCKLSKSWKIRTSLLTQGSVTCEGVTFQPSLCTAIRGHNLKLQVQYQQGPKNFSARVTEVWNRLSPDNVNAPSDEDCKTRLAKEFGARPDLY